MASKQGAMSKVQLARIKSLTFYKDAVTAARRTEPLPQLTCIGQPCRLYTPDVVRCVNVGGEGTEVDWKVSVEFDVNSTLGDSSGIVRSRFAGSATLRTGRSVMRGLERTRRSLCPERYASHTRGIECTVNTFVSGSCALEYRLVQVPDAFRKPELHRVPSGMKSWLRGKLDIHFNFSTN